MLVAFVRNDLRNVNLLRVNPTGNLYPSQFIASLPWRKIQMAIVLIAGTSVCVLLSGRRQVGLLGVVLAHAGDSALHLLK